MKPVTLYTCTTMLDVDLAFESPDITLYTSLKALKASRSCWKECGIVEVRLTKKRVVRKAKPLEQWVPVKLDEMKKELKAIKKVANKWIKKNSK